MKDVGQVLSQLTLEEKAALCSGSSHINVPYPVGAVEAAAGLVDIQQI